MATAAQLKARKLFAQRSRAGTLNKPAAKKATRKRAASSGVSSVSVRDVGSAVKTSRAKNPTKPRFHQFTYNVEVHVALYGEWTPVGGFDNLEYAKMFAHLFADKSKRQTRVIDVYTAGL